MRSDYQYENGKWLPPTCPECGEWLEEIATNAKTWPVSEFECRNPGCAANYTDREQESDGQPAETPRV